MFPDVYREYKEEKIISACHKRPFVVQDQITWNANMVLDPYTIAGRFEKIISPEFDCRILDMVSNDRLLGDYQDTPYSFGAGYIQEVCETDFYIGNNCLGESFEARTIINSDSETEIRVTNPLIDGLYLAGQIRQFVDYWIDNASVPPVLRGGQVSDNDFFYRHPTFVKAGEKITFNFRVRFEKTNPSDAPMQLPAVYFAEALNASAKYLAIFVETMV